MNTGTEWKRNITVWGALPSHLVCYKPAARDFVGWTIGTKIKWYDCNWEMPANETIPIWVTK